MKFAVGCPVRNRAWILPHWWDYTEAALAAAGIDDVDYYFVLGDSEDGTLEALRQCAGKYKRRMFFTSSTQEESLLLHARVWNDLRYDEMVRARNALLRMVRENEPDYFLSLDSDILLSPSTIQNMLEHDDRFDAVGAKTYMTPGGDWCTSYAMLRNGALHRDESCGVFAVDVIMAIKLMTPQAYAVDYVHHGQGEDIGWSIACRERGLRLGWDGRVANKHVMSPEHLDRVDPRCNY